jgi:hypothetical protein
MVVVARADLIYSLNGYLRTFTAEWTALGLDSAAGWKDPPPGRTKRTGPRISSEIQGGDDGWKMPTRAIVLRKAGGPVIGDDYALGLKTTRIDTFSYGATGLEADQVWAMLDAILVPSTGSRSASFTRSGCAIVDIRPEADALAQTDPDTGWRRVWAPFVVTWRSL